MILINCFDRDTYTYNTLGCWLNKRPTQGHISNRDRGNVRKIPQIMNCYGLANICNICILNTIFTFRYMILLVRNLNDLNKNASIKVSIPKWLQREGHECSYKWYSYYILGNFATTCSIIHIRRQMCDDIFLNNKINWFRFRFHFSLFPSFELTIFQNWFR